MHFVNTVRNHESTRVRLKNTSEISLEKTYKWFEIEKPQWKIIEVNNTPVGYFRFSQNTGETICMGCDIHPDHRRRGYAKEAYKKEITNLYQDGYVIVWLEVYEDNIPARNLYKSLGFCDIGYRSVNNKKYIAMVHRRINE